MIFVISGPSGSGKTTVREKLLKDKQLLSCGLVQSVSLTTRPRRKGEHNKKDYIFITEREFRKEQKAKKILEWTKYLGYYYATPRDYLEKQLGKTKSIILCLDLKGAAKVKQLYPETTVSIFIVPPSISELNKRIKKRSKSSQKEIRERLRLAEKELGACGVCDYRVVNRSLSQAVSRVKRIILREISN